MQRHALLGGIRSVFTNLIQCPTRSTLPSESVLDRFIAYIDKQLVRAGELLSDISDHLPIFPLIE